MTDLEWARAFVGCKIEGTGRRFNETVDVLVKKLAEVRQGASGRCAEAKPEARDVGQTTSDAATGGHNGLMSSQNVHNRRRRPSLNRAKRRTGKNYFLPVGKNS